MDGSVDLQDWVGRSETSEAVADAGTADRLAATLDRDVAPARPGDPLPLLAHWCLFLPCTPASGLGPDGHPLRGGFLPPVHHLPRRMWAGSRLQFLSPLRIGMRLRRHSTITSVTERSGGSGPLVFVTVRHQVSESDGPVLLVDEHDIVYRGVTGAAVKPAAPAPEGPWRRALVPDAVLLFRYSALTFNGHRIHYDRRYVQEVEGYPGLVVHGPLIATLLLGLVGERLPEATVRAFSFRAHAPLFDGDTMSLNGTPPGPDGKVALWAANAGGGLAMQAEALVA